MTAFNACRSELGKEPTWFVLAERDNICVGLLRNGQWSSIRLRHVVVDWFEEALVMLERKLCWQWTETTTIRCLFFAPEISA